MIVKLLIEHHFEFLSLKGGCRGSSESTLVKMSNCWKSHATAQMYLHPIMKHTKKLHSLALVDDVILFGPRREKTQKCYMRATKV